MDCMGCALDFHSIIVVVNPKVKERMVLRVSFWLFQSQQKETNQNGNVSNVFVAGNVAHVMIQDTVNGHN